MTFKSDFNTINYKGKKEAKTENSINILGIAYQEAKASKQEAKKKHVERKKMVKEKRLQ